jgi:hypothetical protein
MLEARASDYEFYGRMYSRSEGLLFPSLNVDAKHQEPEDNRPFA